MSDNPAAPTDFAMDGPEAARAIAATNFGIEGGLTEAQDAPPHPAGRPATLAINAVAARAFLDACTGSNPRVAYGLGAKVPFHGAVPGQDFTKVDCSGFVREVVFRATNPPFDFSDGSVTQHGWVERQGFEKSTVAAGMARDGAVRIAFLSPQDTSIHIGHVVLLHDGVTWESHGGLGPDSRPWTGTGWQAQTTVFVLTPA